MPAQGLGRCDLRKTVRTLPPGCYRNARAGAWTLRQMPRHLVAQRHDDIAMPAQGLGRCDSRTCASAPRASSSQCPRRGLDAATCCATCREYCSSRIAMPAQGLGRCDTELLLLGPARLEISQCPRRGLDAATVSAHRAMTDCDISQCPRRGLDAATGPSGVENC